MIFEVLLSPTLYVLEVCYGTSSVFNHMVPNCNFVPCRTWWWRGGGDSSLLCGYLRVDFAETDCDKNQGLAMTSWGQKDKLLLFPLLQVGLNTSHLTCRKSAVLMLGKVFGSELSFTFGKYQHDPFPTTNIFWQNQIQKRLSLSVCIWLMITTSWSGRWH